LLRDFGRRSLGVRLLARACFGASARFSFFTLLALGSRFSRGLAVCLLRLGRLGGSGSRRWRIVPQAEDTRLDPNAQVGMSFLARVGERRLHRGLGIAPDVIEQIALHRELADLGIV